MAYSKRFIWEEYDCTKCSGTGRTGKRRFPYFCDFLGNGPELITDYECSSCKGRGTKKRKVKKKKDE